MAGETSGSDVTMLVDTDTSSSENFQAVGSQTGLSRDEERDDIETSSKENDAKTFIYGKYGSSGSLDHFYVPSGAGFEAMKDAIRNGNKIKIRVKDSNDDTEEAEVLLTSSTEDWPDNDAATVSIDFLVTGTWSKV